MPSRTGRRAKGAAGRAARCGARRPAARSAALISRHQPSRSSQGDQVFLLRPVLPQLIDHWDAVGRRLGEGAVTGLGDDGGAGGQEFGEIQTETFQGHGVGGRHCHSPGTSQQTSGMRGQSSTGRRWAMPPRATRMGRLPGARGRARGSQRRAMGPMGRRLSRSAMAMLGGRLEKGPGASVGLDHGGVEGGSPGLVAEEMLEQFGPVEAAQGAGRDARPDGAGQGEVADVAQNVVRRQVGQKPGLGVDPGRPVGMGRPVGGGGGGAVHVGGGRSCGNRNRWPPAGG